MGSVVAYQLGCARIIAGHDLDLGPIGQRIGQVADCSVNGDSDGLFGQRLGDGRGQIGARRTVIQRTLCSIRHGKRGHCHRSFGSTPAYECR